jgi:hypothetical protein
MDGFVRVRSKGCIGIDRTSKTDLIDVESNRSMKVDIRKVTTRIMLDLLLGKECKGLIKK